MKILGGVKLFRDVRVGDTVFRGSKDTVSRSVDYIFDALPPDTLAGRAVLDIGAAGGAVCFEAVNQGCRSAVGVEIAEERIRGADAIKRLTRARNIHFVQQDFFGFLRDRSRQFDVVFLLNVLHHLGNPFPLLRRVARTTRDVLVIESPDDVDVSHYSEYGENLLHLEGARPAKTTDDFIRFLALSNFALVHRRSSEPGGTFSRGDESPRSIYVFRRSAVGKTLDERLGEVEPYRTTRDITYSRARAMGMNEECSDDTNIVARLGAAFPHEWRTASVNFVIAGPRASGKTHLYERVGPTHHPAYNPKVFKFPDADSKRGLSRHLNPRPGQGLRFAQVLVSTADDEGAHCTTEELADALSGRRVICLLLNVGFVEHVRRLHQREAAQGFLTDVDYDVSLRFECDRVAAALTSRGVRLRVLTIGPPAVTSGVGPA